VRPLRELSIRLKLVLIIMAATGGALLLASAGLIVADFARSRGELAHDLASLADVLAQNSTAALAFDDATAARETLASLAARPAIVAAGLYKPDGRLFAGYRRPERRAARRVVLPPRPELDGNRFERGAFVLFHGVALKGQRIGTVYLRSDLQELYGSLRAQAMSVAAVLLAAALLALVLSSGLQRVISGPILHLAAVAQEVSERRDYTLRAGKRSGDELGRLVDAFNQMLGQIQQRDSALQQAKEELEQRVAERTRELQQELAERRRAEQELAQRNLDLAQSNRELDDFAYIASHDLKEPLRGIHNFSVFLVEDYADKLDGEGRAKLETLVRLSRRMEALIDSLLHFSRVGRVDLAIDRVDLDATVRAVVDSLAINLGQAAVDVRIPRPLPTVRCDRARVGEIFHNLIVNAMKYNDKAEKWVEIGVVPERPLVFYVRDNGIGIPEKHVDSIFRIFKRLHGRDKFGGGTGAGLTIVKKIVERHHGKVWVESQPGQGTTVCFTLDRGGPAA
jgi:signal transduction histidine kinase